MAYLTADGCSEFETIILAVRNALRNMAYRLRERGWSSGQTDVICCVAVDLRIGNVVVSAFLPERILDSAGCDE
jgi:hypothetical protein